MIDMLPVNQQPKKRCPYKKISSNYQINIISLTDYDKFSFKGIVKIENREQLINIMENKDNGSSFEVLSSGVLRIFLDLENIPIDKPQLYKEIIIMFIKYAQLEEDTPYTVTINKGSRHLGLSYHVIFAKVTTRTVLKNLVANFRKDNPEYKHYVDGIIYTPNRLFRLPGQYGILNTRTRKLVKEAKEDIEFAKSKDVNYNYTQYNDIHEVYEQCGKNKTNNPYENDFIIQNIIGIPPYTYTWEAVEQEVKIHKLKTPRQQQQEQQEQQAENENEDEHFSEPKPKNYQRENTRISKAANNEMQSLINLLFLNSIAICL